MGQEVNTQQRSTADHDLQNDPVLAPLRSHGPSRRGRRVAVAVVLVGLVAAGGWYAYNVYESRSREADAERIRAQAEAEPAPPPTLSPVQRYGAGFGPETRRELLELAKHQHGERYGGRGLWVGDELRLLVPTAEALFDTGPPAG